MKRVKTRKTFSTAKQSLKIGDEKSDIVQVDAPTESETLSLSNCKLRSLPDITAHPYLKHLDLSNNNIESVSQLTKLAELKSLTTLRISNNPLTTKINYIYHILCTVPNLTQIDNVPVSPQLHTHQLHNGTKIVHFLYDKCYVLATIKQKQLQQGAKTLAMYEHYRDEMQKVGEADLMGMNEVLGKVPLMREAEPTREQCREIVGFLLEEVLTEMAVRTTPFVEKLLLKIEVANEEEESLLSSEAHVETIMQLLREQMLQQYMYTMSLISHDKHILSAETNASESHRNHSLSSCYFAAEEDFLAAMCRLMSRQVEVIIKAVQASEKQKEILQCSELPLYESLGASDNHLLEYIDDRASPTHQTVYQFDTSPQKIYSNKVILSSLLECLEKVIRHIVFKRILTFKNKQVYQSFFQSIQQVFVPYHVHDLEYSMQMIKQEAERVEYAEVVLGRAKMQRIFEAWKRVKKRKVCLLRRIIKRKAKIDKFMMSIALMTWKVQSRAEKITKMASMVNLQPYKPKSKKAIDQAYRRVKQKLG